jgi:hypothetical protein
MAISVVLLELAISVVLCVHCCVSQPLCTNLVAFAAVQVMTCQCAPVALPCGICLCARLVVSVSACALTLWHWLLRTPLRQLAHVH